VARRSLVGAARRRLALRTRARTARATLTRHQNAWWRTRPIRPHAVLYEAFYGNGMLDNPEALFRYLLDQPDQQHLEHIWVLDDPARHPEVTAEFAEDGRVRFVVFDSADYLKALATSRYLINNSTFGQHFAKREGQVYVNTWHGVPLKFMGYDMANGGVTSRNITRNFLNADYLVSANPFMTETMYRRAYRLQGIYRGAVIEEGYPRSDRQMQAVAEPAAAVRLLEDRGVRIRGRKVVLFAPTWRGDSFHDPHVNAAQLLSTVRGLQKALADDHVVLLKVHQVIYEAVRSRVGPDCDFLVPNSVPSNITLGVADLLVTDYSSIFFDYLSTGRPVVHFVPDLDEYRTQRGLYLTEADLCGPVVDALPDLVDAVRKALADGPLSVRAQEGAARYNARDDGAVCERLVNLVFRGHDESRYTVHRDFGTDKETLLIHLGAMKSMGITTSALNLLRNLDYDRYDVTAFYGWSRGRDRAKNINLVDERVRVLPRAPVLNGSPRRVREQTEMMMAGGLPERLTRSHLAFWRDEWQRMFGSARFDHLIDFSGYGCYSPFLFSAVEARQKSIWLHNDLVSDMERRVGGEKPLSYRLRAVFSTYRTFDNLVSVSKALHEVNRELLAPWTRPEQFTYARNTIDGDRVLRMAGIAGGATGDNPPAPDGEPALATFDTRNIAAAMTSVLEHFTVQEVIREARGRVQLQRAGVDTGGSVTFVSVGRLSAEKNHARLIRAFAKVHDRNPHIRLVIMGTGELEQELNDLVVNLGLEMAVVLPGLVDNPFAIMAKADCFVLSSDYEGQPMVILEARTLGLPVITTNFSSVSDSVPEGAGLVVPQTVKGVAAGLQAFLDGKVPSLRLDPVAYNAEAMAQFEAAIHHSLTRVSAG
jgi:CDP-glycerol glycerophosphotransferase (TagB/SpsB family)/glycosyltransferase involved in cell wall biosynthesis